MAQLVNATIRVDPRRLNFPRETLHPRQLHSFVVSFVGIPEDCSSAIIRVFKTDRQAHFDIPISVGASGASAYIVGTCFPDVGSSYYEIHAYDAEGNPTALGCGEILVSPFSQSASPIEPGQPVPIMQVADAMGALHTIQAVPDGMGGYTTIIDADTEGGQTE